MFLIEWHLAANKNIQKLLQKLEESLGTTSNWSKYSSIEPEQHI